MKRLMSSIFIVVLLFCAIEVPKAKEVLIEYSIDLESIKDQNVKIDIKALTITWNEDLKGWSLYVNNVLVSTRPDANILSYDFGVNGRSYKMTFNKETLTSVFDFVGTNYETSTAKFEIINAEGNEFTWSEWQESNLGLATDQQETKTLYGYQDVLSWGSNWLEEKNDAEYYQSKEQYRTSSVFSWTEWNETQSYHEKEESKKQYQYINPFGWSDWSTTQSNNYLEKNKAQFAEAGAALDSVGVDIGSITLDENGKDIRIFLPFGTKNVNLELKAISNNYLIEGILNGTGIVRGNVNLKEFNSSHTIKIVNPLNNQDTKEYNIRFEVENETYIDRFPQKGGNIPNKLVSGTSGNITENKYIDALTETSYDHPEWGGMYPSGVFGSGGLADFGGSGYLTLKLKDGLTFKPTNVTINGSLQCHQSTCGIMSFDIKVSQTDYTSNGTSILSVRNLPRDPGRSYYNGVINTVEYGKYLQFVNIQGRSGYGTTGWGGTACNGNQYYNPSTQFQTLTYSGYLKYSDFSKMEEDTTLQRNWDYLSIDNSDELLWKDCSGSCPAGNPVRLLYSYPIKSLIWQESPQTVYEKKQYRTRTEAEAWVYKEGNFIKNTDDKNPFKVTTVYGKSTNNWMMFDGNDATQTSGLGSVDPAYPGGTIINCEFSGVIKPIKIKFKNGSKNTSSNVAVKLMLILEDGTTSLLKLYDNNIVAMSNSTYILDIPIDADLKIKGLKIDYWTNSGQGTGSVFEYNVMEWEELESSLSEWGAWQDCPSEGCPINNEYTETRTLYGQSETYSEQDVNWTDIESNEGELVNQRTLYRYPISGGWSDWEDCPIEGCPKLSEDIEFKQLFKLPLTWSSPGGWQEDPYLKSLSRKLLEKTMYRYKHDKKRQLKIYYDLKDLTKFYLKDGIEKNGIVDYGSVNVNGADYRITLNLATNKMAVNGEYTEVKEIVTMKRLFYEVPVPAHELDLNYVEKGISYRTFDEAENTLYTNQEIDTVTRNESLTLTNKETGLTVSTPLAQFVSMWKRYPDGTYDTTVTETKQFVCQWKEGVCQPVRDSIGEGSRTYAVFGSTHNFKDVIKGSSTIREELFETQYLNQNFKQWNTDWSTSQQGYACNIKDGCLLDNRTNYEKTRYLDTWGSWSDWISNDQELGSAWQKEEKQTFLGYGTPGEFITGTPPADTQYNEYRKESYFETTFSGWLEGFGKNSSTSWNTSTVYDRQYRTRAWINSGYTAYSDWGSWSGWTTGSHTNGDLKQVETRDIAGSYSNWGRWSSYMASSCTNSNTMDCRSQTEYQYKRYYVRCSDYMRLNFAFYWNAYGGSDSYCASMNASKPYFRSNDGTETSSWTTSSSMYGWSRIASRTLYSYRTRSWQDGYREYRYRTRSSWWQDTSSWGVWGSWSGDSLNMTEASCNSEAMQCQYKLKHVSNVASEGYRIVPKLWDVKYRYREKNKELYWEYDNPSGWITGNKINEYRYAYSGSTVWEKVKGTASSGLGSYYLGSEKTVSLGWSDVQIEKADDGDKFLSTLPNMTKWDIDQVGNQIKVAAIKNKNLKDLQADNEFEFIPWESANNISMGTYSKYESHGNSAKSNFLNDRIFVPYIYVLPHWRAKYQDTEVKEYEDVSYSYSVGTDYQGSDFATMKEVTKNISRDTYVIYIDPKDPFKNYDTLPKNWQGQEALIEAIKNADFDNPEITIKLTAKDMADMKKWLEEEGGFNTLGSCELLRKFKHIFIKQNDEMKQFFNSTGCGE